MCKCVYAHVKGRGKSQCLNCTYLSYWVMVSHWTWCLLIGFDWPVRHRDSPCLYFPRAAITDSQQCFWLFLKAVFWGSRLRSYACRASPYYTSIFPGLGYVFLCSVSLIWTCCPNLAATNKHSQILNISVSSGPKQLVRNPFANMRLSVKLRALHLYRNTPCFAFCGK